MANQKGQIALEALLIFGVLVIGVIIFSMFYFQSINPRETPEVELGSDRIFKDKVNTYSDGVTQTNPPIDPPILCGNGVCDEGETFLTCPSDCDAPTNISNLNLILDPDTPSLINFDFNIIATVTSEDDYANVTKIVITKYDDYSSYEPTTNCEFNGSYNSEFTNVGQLLPSANANELSNSFTFSCNIPGKYNFSFDVSSLDNSQSLSNNLINVGYDEGKEIIISTACNNPLGSVLFDPVGGTFSNPINVSLSYEDPNCLDYNIHYTTNGTDPTLSSPIYSSVITLADTTTIKAKVFAKNSLGQDVNGVINSQEYIKTGTVNTPTASPNDLCLIYTNPINVSLGTSTQGATIRYTLDGSEPTESSVLYTSPISVSSTKTIKVKAYKNGWTPSNTLTVIYRVETTWNYCSGILNSGIYHISQPKHLNCIRLNMDGNFVLDSDIDLIGINFDPIGSSDCEFSGSFDGQGHIIRNLSINRPINNNVGLFGSVYSSNIKNIGLENVNLIGLSLIGALSGVIRDSNISNSYSTGTVNGGGDYIGGLIGSSSGTKIDNCYSTTTVHGNNNVGGLVGYGAHNGVIGSGALQTIISNSYSNGNVSGKWYVGGLIGINFWSSIFDSRATGNVNGQRSIGGFVGFVDEGTIRRSSSAGNVTGSSEYVGGFIGLGTDKSFITESYSTGNVINTGGFYDVGGFAGSLSLTNGQINDCYSRGNVTSGSYGVGFAITWNMPVTNNYSTGSAPYGGFGSGDNCVSNYWDVEKSEQLDSGGCGEGMTTDDMKIIDTFYNWDFISIWDINPTINDGYPYLRNNPPQ